MKKAVASLLAVLIMWSLALAGCGSPRQEQAGGETGLKVLAVESFLADIAQNVAGDRVKVDTLLPLGLDPHAYEPTPRDVSRIAECQALIVNGAGFEDWLTETINSAGGQRVIIEASAGLTSRAAREGEALYAGQGETPEEHPQGDPHFWLNPLHVIRYVENIRDGLTALDPAGKETYSQNAARYTAQLQELDAWIEAQVNTLPPEKRLIVTNHESFGYFADRYGFRIIGTIIPSVSTGSAPSAQQMARLVDAIRAAGAAAVFLETGADPKLAEQIAAETGVKVVDNLYTHSLTGPEGGAPTYIEMMKANTRAIVEALK